VDSTTIVDLRLPSSTVEFTLLNSNIELETVELGIGLITPNSKTVSKCSIACVVITTYLIKAQIKSAETKKVVIATNKFIVKCGICVELITLFLFKFDFTENIFF
jgi:hypothetical protein